MNRSFYGLLGVTAVLAASCKDDPTSGLRGGPVALELQYAYREVIIADSVRVTATVRDAQNNSLVIPVTVTTCNAAIATVSPSPADPLPITAFYVKGVSFGTTCVAAAANGLTDTMQVATFPFRIEVTGPDTVVSGTTVQFGFAFFDALGNPVTGVPAPTWASTASGVAAVDASGNVSGRAPGQVRVTATGTGSPAGGISFGRTFVVVPGVFTGGFTPTSGGSADVVTFTRGAGEPEYDTDTGLAFGLGFTIASFTDQTRVTADQIMGAAPVASATGPIPFVLTNIGPNQLALAGTFDISRTDLADPYDAVNDDPLTAPNITANGAYFIVLSGACVQGAGGTDCDDYFTITNTLARDDTITVNTQWASPADIDILWCDAACSVFVGNFDGATVSNPESSTVIIPAGTTWRLWLNLWDPNGSTSSLARVRVTGIG